MADNIQKHYDDKIAKLLASNNNDDSKEDGMADVFGKMNGMIGMFSAFTGNPMIKTAMKYYGFIKIL